MQLTKQYEKGKHAKKSNKLESHKQVKRRATFDYVWKKGGTAETKAIWGYKPKYTVDNIDFLKASIAKYSSNRFDPYSHSGIH